MPAQFEPKQQVVHPKLGIGCVARTEEEAVDGRTARYLVVEFPRTTLTLRIPEDKIDRSGLRRLSSPDDMRSALAVLPEPPTALSGPWLRHAPGYGAKLHSGEPAQLAEILRDLHVQAHGAGRTKLYGEALLRLAEELAGVEGIAVDQAQARIEALLAPAP